MKEFNKIGQIIQQHYPIRRPRKKWLVAQSRGTNKAQALRNSNTEYAYHRLIEAVKKLYLKPGEVYFERDYTLEDTENLVNMHCLMSSSCYLLLECTFCYDFQVEYAFDNCPFEAEIRQMLRPHPLDSQAKEREMKPDFKTFFETVLKVQDNQFIHFLKGN